MRFCPTTLATARIGVLKSTLVVLLCAASGQRASGQQAVKLTLEEVLRLANQNNLDLAAARAKRAAALAGIAIAKERPNPTVSVGASRDLPHENVLLDQPFELGLKRAKRIEVARGESALNVIEIDILARQVRHKTRDAFYRVLLSRAQSDQAADALKLAQRLQQIAHDRFAVGDVAQLEVLQADLEVARADVDYKVLLQEQRTARSELATLLNQPEASLPELEGTIADLPPALEQNALVEKAHSSSPEIQRTTQERTIEASRLSLLKWQRVPNLDIQAGVDLNSPPDFQVGGRGQVGITLPIFSRNQGEIAQSNANLKVLDLSLQAARRNVEGAVEAAYLDVAAKRTQVELYRDNLVPATLKLEAMAEESYQAGKSNVLNVIDAQRRTSDIKRAYLDSLFNFQSAFASLEEIVGEPLSP